MKTKAHYARVAAKNARREKAFKEALEAERLANPDRWKATPQVVVCPPGNFPFMFFLL